MLFDLHVHTTFSPCSGLSLEEILGKARSIGLDGVCLTDHESMAAGGLVREGPQDDGLCVIIGQEYATRQGDFLLFGPYESLPQGLEARHLLLYVQATGGVAVAAHPCEALPPTKARLWPPPPVPWLILQILDRDFKKTFLHIALSGLAGVSWNTIVSVRCFRVVIVRHQGFDVLKSPARLSR